MTLPVFVVNTAEADGANSKAQLLFASWMTQFVPPNCTGMKLMALAGEKLKSSVSCSKLKELTYGKRS